MNLKLFDSLDKTENIVKFTLYDRFRKSGNLRFIQTTFAYNMITLNGHIQIADQNANELLPKMRYIGVGDASGGKNAASNTLQNELARVHMQNWNNSGTNAIIYQAQFIEGSGTGNLVEAGVFNDQIAGNMQQWADFAMIAKGLLNILQVEWTTNF